MGWDLRKGRFMLPNYYLNSDGDVCPYEAMIPTPDIPGRCLAQPGTMSPAELEITIEDSGMAGPLWACFIAAMANILAPAYKQTTAGIGLVGAGAELAGNGIADAMGCAAFRVTKQMKASSLVAVKVGSGLKVMFSTLTTY